jgi:hypothetical protein
MENLFLFLFLPFPVSLRSPSVEVWLRPLSSVTQSLSLSQPRSLLHFPAQRGPARAPPLAATDGRAPLVIPLIAPRPSRTRVQP